MPHGHKQKVDAVAPTHRDAVAPTHGDAEVVNLGLGLREYDSLATSFLQQLSAAAATAAATSRWGSQRRHAPQ